MQDLPPSHTDLPSSHQLSNSVDIFDFAAVAVAAVVVIAVVGVVVAVVAVAVG